MRNLLKQANRIIIKVGTSTLIYKNGHINLKAIDQLAFVLSDLKKQGKEVILVSSGAIGVGLNKLNMDKRPSSIPEQQAVASIGQIELMMIYMQRFQVYHQQIGQVLLTRDVVDYPESRENVINTLEALLKQGVVPIINENDTTSVDELDHSTKFGDNDQLSAIVCQLIQGDALIMLSDIDGFYTENPYSNNKAQLIHEVYEITDDILAKAGGNGGRFGTGGMLSKLKAASIIFKSRSTMVLANGKDPRIIYDVLEGKQIGTLFAIQR